MPHAGERVFRFAPSPNGYLHLGHAYSALLNFDLARRAGGCLLLRIEDIDRVRARPEYERAILEDLAWLGLEWEEPVRRQSEHFDDYAGALAKLGALGLLYPCRCTRGDIARATEARGWPRDPDGAPLYPGTCRGASPPPSPSSASREREAAAVARALGEAPNLLPLLRSGEGPGRGLSTSLRLDMAKAAAMVGGELRWREAESGEIAADPAAWGDVILARKDVPASYHIAVVVDDALQGVTDVVRGSDLFAATSLHRLLQSLLGLPAPRYRHHELVRDEDGRKLAKSRLSKPLRELRAEGATPADVRRMVGLG
ncbi:tRNA glutamyl-Q(34) synthetase GluQRS [Methylosinus sp. Sm6]|uniref:tRNA glutamyl-Q(34) synthetase GluQRS n=1 Tax=Methylosinus sp. Sm6 TaxID=2866948 RepID=UPI0021085500|nr:tRNA glutamyl-Q(34) synthetase GluQRS [Methylosinus sp. Sm6]